jgi:hypothetical protein
MSGGLCLGRKEERARAACACLFGRQKAKRVSALLVYVATRCHLVLHRPARRSKKGAAAAAAAVAAVDADVAGSLAAPENFDGIHLDWCSGGGHSSTMLRLSRLD